MGKLTALKVKSAGPGVHIDGKGLLLRVKESGARSWVLRVQHRGRRQDIGLGSTDDLTLAEARERAAQLRKIARQGKDAIAERDRDKMPALRTFAEAAEHAHRELGKGWSDKTAAQFKASLDQHAIPALGRQRVDLITAKHLIDALAPIWTEKPQIARKVRHRILRVLTFAKSHGWRTAAVPLANELSLGLAKQPRSAGFAAVPYADVPGIVTSELAKEPSPARLALVFTILTAARSGEVRQMRWEQVDIQRGVWVRPAEMMKARKGHTVTLGSAARDVLARAQALFGESGLIFPAPRADKPLSDMALGKMLRAAGRTETVNGFCPARGAQHFAQRHVG